MVSIPKNDCKINTKLNSLLDYSIHSKSICSNPLWFSQLLKGLLFQKSNVCILCLSITNWCLGIIYYIPKAQSRTTYILRLAIDITNRKWFSECTIKRVNISVVLKCLPWDHKFLNRFLAFFFFFLIVSYAKDLEYIQ